MTVVDTNAASTGYIGTVGYGAYSDCGWIIQDTGTAGITLEFEEISTELAERRFFLNILEHAHGERRGPVPS